MIRFFLVCLCFSQLYSLDPSIKPSLENYMSLEDQKTTGVIRLTTEQKNALASWLGKHGCFSLVNEEDMIHALKISINVYGGKIIQLSDNSVYEIAKEDQIISAGWLSAIPIKVTSSNDENYPFVLTNLRNRTFVKAKKGILN